VPRLANVLQTIFPWWNRVGTGSPPTPGTGVGEGYYNASYYRAAYYHEPYYPKPPGGSSSVIERADITFRARSAVIAMRGGDS